MNILNGAVALLAIIVVASAPTNALTNTCFPDGAALRTAVDSYISQDCSTNSNCAIGQTYGYPIGTWCTSLVTDMSYLFYDKATFNDNIAGWDVSNVTTMQRMFRSASVFNQNIGAWDVSKVTDMGMMFYSSPFNQDISGWNVGKVTCHTCSDQQPFSTKIYQDGM
jgi:surface protein